ncbi:hypothetical protein [Undibacterium luofuense]|nr:hypothetical protein [Undibacterium luofuense]
MHNAVRFPVRKCLDKHRLPSVPDGDSTINKHKKRASATDPFPEYN